jgi:hypothetical protein
MFLIGWLSWGPAAASASAQSGLGTQNVATSQDSTPAQRIITREQVAAAARPAGAAPFLILGWPYRQLLAAMNAGLISAERHRVPEHLADIQERLSFSAGSAKARVSAPVSSTRSRPSSSRGCSF